MHELRAAGHDDHAVHHDVHVVGLDVVEEPLVVRDHEGAESRIPQLVHAVRDDLEAVDVQSGIRFVEDRDLWLEHGQLQDLCPLLLPPENPSFR